MASPTVAARSWCVGGVSGKVILPIWALSLKSWGEPYFPDESSHPDERNVFGKGMADKRL